MVETVLSSEITRSQHEEVKVAYENGECSYILFIITSPHPHKLLYGIYLVTEQRNVKALFVGFCVAHGYPVHLIHATFYFNAASLSSSVFSYRKLKICMNKTSEYISNKHTYVCKPFITTKNPW